MMCSLNEWLGCVRGAKRLALISHISPDGDTVGAALALRLAFLAIGKEVDVICDGEADQTLGYLPGVEAMIRPEEAGGVYDAAIAVDVSDRRLLGKAERVFDSAAVRLVIDHHGTNDGYGDCDYIRGGECACCVLAYEAIEAMGVRMTGEMATCLMTGLSTDTGHFMYPYTTPHAFEVAGRLRAAGADVSDITRRLYRTQPRELVELTRIAYRKLRFELGGRVGVIELTTQELQQAGCAANQTGGLVNKALEVEGVRMAILATQREEGVKLSLRAVEPDTVSDIAKVFGGGGHAQAAGCTIDAPMEQAVRMALDEMAKKL